MKNPNHLIEKVCEYYHIDQEALKGSCRKPQIVMPRFMTQYLLKKEMKLTYKSIGNLFGRRHTSIIHAIQQIDEQLTNKFDGTIRNDLSNLKQLINNN